MRNREYVRCLLPVEGWVFLPDPTAEYNWEPLDAIYQKKRRIRDAKKRAEDKANGKKVDEKIGDGQYDEDGYMNPINEEEELKGGDDYDEDFDETLIVEDRRKYNEQRMMRQTVPPDLSDMEINKAMQIKLLRWLTFYFRRHPFLPGLCINRYIRKIAICARIRLLNC